MLTTYTVSSLGEYYDVIHKISRSNARLAVTQMYIRM